MKLGKRGTEVVDMLEEALGENDTKPATIYKSVKRSPEGREDAKDDAREGRPFTSHTVDNIEPVRNLVLSNRRIPVRMNVEEVPSIISLGSVHLILIFFLFLEMRAFTARIVPWFAQI